MRSKRSSSEIFEYETGAKRIQRFHTMRIHEELETLGAFSSVNNTFVSNIQSKDNAAIAPLSPALEVDEVVRNCWENSSTKNVYVCGQQIMASKHGAKPIGGMKKRGKLAVERARITDFAVLLAMIGLGLAIIDSELVERSVVSETHFASIAMRSIIIITTIILLAVIVWYHAIEVKILMLDNQTRDWCVVVTGPRLIQCIVELVICCVCPIPATVQAPYARLIEDKETIIVYAPLSGVLTAAMFLRLYLLCRMTGFHSRQFRDAATRTVASMSRISVDFTFVMKTLMVSYPLSVLLVLWIGFAVSIAWLFAQCERQGAEESQKPGYLNAMWFTMATLMANGYGDIQPATYCGRALSIITSLAGIGITASLIAVVKQKLQLTQSERRVNEFVRDSRLTTEKKNAAAAVLQHTWFIHKSINDEKADFGKIRTHQRRFINAINEFRRVKFDQRMLFDDSYDLSEITHIQKSLKQMMMDLQNRHVHATRLTHFAGQQLDQLQKLIGQWQTIRAANSADHRNQHADQIDTNLSNAQQSEKNDSNVIAGEVAHIAYDNISVINEYW